MIYVIDEDINQMKPFVLELQLRSYEVKQIRDADEALDEIQNLTSEDFLLVDVMLATHPEPSRSAFSREDTKDFKITGIRLLHRIFNKFTLFPRSNAIMFTQASSDSMRTEVERYAKNSGCRLLYKNSYEDPLSFGDELEKIMKEGK